MCSKEKKKKFQIQMYLGDKQYLFQEINKTVYENSKQTKTNAQEIKETDRKKRIICMFGLPCFIGTKCPYTLSKAKNGEVTNTEVAVAS